MLLGHAPRRKVQASNVKYFPMRTIHLARRSISNFTAYNQVIFCLWSVAKIVGVGSAILTMDSCDYFYYIITSYFNVLRQGVIPFSHWTPNQIEVLVKYNREMMDHTQDNEMHQSAAMNSLIFILCTFRMQ